MLKAQNPTSKSGALPQEIRTLSPSQRRAAAERKYAEAVGMYASTDLSVKSVAEKCGVSAWGLSSHIRNHHRSLLFARYGLDSKREDLYTLKVKPPKGQSLKTHLKYKDAIEACGDVGYIEYNVSQIARMFKLDGTALASQLRTHFPDVIPNREKLRQRLGMADNTHRGVRPVSKETYSEALSMYRDTDMTIQEVAERCKVSKSGFGQFLRYYHKDVINTKSLRRKDARKKTGERRPGQLSGNGALYGPRPETVALYGEALELYCQTAMTIEEIAEKSGVSIGGFKGYLHQWHRGEKLRRRGYEWDGKSLPDLKETKHFLKSTAAKYAPAIASLRERPRPISEAASEFGLNSEVFRQYLKTHEPELASFNGMVLNSDGRPVKRSSTEKYAQAVYEYATTAEPLKSIAERHGIVYKSLAGYMRRNCREERESHLRVVQSSLQSPTP